MLCCGICLAILRKLLLQGFLQRGIPGPERCVGSEHIPEPQVIAPLRVVYSHQVQMMRPDLRSRFFHEEIASSIPAHIASIKIAEATEQRPTLGNHRDRGHRHGNIKNGFRVETGYCSAPYMLDIQNQRLEVLVQDTPLLLEQVVPVRMIRNKLYSISSQADHTSSLDLRSNAGPRRNEQATQPRALSPPCFSGRPWSSARVNWATWCVPASLLTDRWAWIVRSRLNQCSLSHRIGVHVLADHFNRHGAHMAITVCVQHPERLGKHLSFTGAAGPLLAPVARQRVQCRSAHPRVGIT